MKGHQDNMDNQHLDPLVESNQGGLGCDHVSIEYIVEIANIRDEEAIDSPITRRYLTVRSRCQTCLHDFYFDGVPVGLLGNGPTVSQDGKAIALPISPIRGMAQGGDNAAITQQIGVQIVRANRGPQSSG